MGYATTHLEILKDPLVQLREYQRRGEGMGDEGMDIVGLTNCVCNADEKDGGGLTKLAEAGWISLTRGGDDNAVRTYRLTASGVSAVKSLIAQGIFE